MSSNGEFRNYGGFDSVDHQTAYIFVPSDIVADAPARPAKKRKIERQIPAVQTPAVNSPSFSFEGLLNGTESPQTTSLRQQLFESSWSETELRIQSVLDEANEGTFVEVLSYIGSLVDIAKSSLLPTGFIVTGPNIASQQLLFNQLSVRLKLEVNGPVVLLRSGEISNLKAAVKQVIRAATNQKTNTYDAEGDYVEQHGRKLLNYDLDILHTFVKARECNVVVIAFQDSEAFDNDLLAELIKLFSSWSDRIPFVLLFGIATSIALFHERLPRSTSRLLFGTQFDVESTSVVLESIFRQTVTSANAHLRLGATLVASLLARQKNHVQSVQSFTCALKYAYMCHFYGNALSVLNDVSRGVPILTIAHLEAVRMLPSFRSLIQRGLDVRDPSFIRDLLENDEVLIKTIKTHLISGKEEVLRILRAMHLVATISPEPVQLIELYLAAFEGTLCNSDFVQRIIDSTKRMDPEEVVEFLKLTKKTIESGCPEIDLDGWADDSSDSLQQLAAISKKLSSLVRESVKNGNPIRSSYAIHNKALRTTVIAQRVQLSYEQSKLSKQDQAFTTLINDVSQLLKKLLACPNPKDLFLHEIWFYDSTSPYKEIFTARPRYAIEHALTAPHDYLNCSCCKLGKGPLATQPATASIYQMYLQAGALINIMDLWSAFLDNQNQNDDEYFDEKETIIRFYQGLVDLKHLGMVKQSKKKVDHLAKVLWEGI